MMLFSSNVTIYCFTMLLLRQLLAAVDLLARRASLRVESIPAKRILGANSHGVPLQNQRVLKGIRGWR